MPARSLFREKPSAKSALSALAALVLFAAPQAIGPGASAETTPVDSASSFANFVSGLWPLAQARGISRKTFDAAFRGVTFDPRVVAHTINQAEFVEPIWQYLATAVYPSRIERGRAKAEKERQWLVKARIEYGVDEPVIMGIWGMETEYGAFEGSDSVIRALANLAFVHYSGEYFRDELLSALSILEKGDITPKAMVGSWAGAMGQTQFMPSSFEAYAVDFDGAGRRDIWNDAADSIGSIANYLAKQGWKRGLPWGYEVRLPADFKLSARDSTAFADLASFSRRGVKRADGGALPDVGEGELLIPAGLRGPVFLVTKNFNAIRRYNNAVSYALGVALLGDAIEGLPGLRTPWPVQDRPLGPEQIRELQTRLKKLGYEVGDIDGRAGEILRVAVCAFQEKRGLMPDGYPTLALLKDVESEDLKDRR